MKLTNFDAAGLEMARSVFNLQEVELMLGWIPPLDGAAGTRNLLEISQCRHLAADPRVKSLVEQTIGADSIPIRAILFDKSPNANWNLGWHQDRKIAVRQRIEAEGFDFWSEKEGVVHCQPPSWVLEAGVAMRIHLDSCEMNNGPLRAIPGSHLGGLRQAPTEAEIANQVTCTAEAGDILLMKPLVFHASSKADTPCHRRVIHIEFCAAKLPKGLEWAYS
ncbi:MAG: phytanoyl-CoA dioxygenase family protein [Fimbriimonadaceae bacterium]